MNKRQQPLTPMLNWSVIVISHSPNTRAHRLSTQIIVAADKHIDNMVHGGYAVTIFGRMLRAVDTHLRACMPGGVELTDTELAIGWLIESGRIQLKYVGTNAWVQYCGTEPLVFDTSCIFLDFADVPTYRLLQHSESIVTVAEARLKEAQRLLLDAKRTRLAAYETLREAAVSQEAEAVPA